MNGGVAPEEGPRVDGIGRDTGDRVVFRTKLGVDDCGGASLSSACVDRACDIGAHLAGRSEGGPDGGSAVGLRGLNACGGEGASAAIVATRNGDTLASVGGFGDALILVRFVGPGAARIEGATIEAIVSDLGRGAEASKGGGNVNSSAA